MNTAMTIITGLVAMVIWELLRRLLLYFHKVLVKKNTLKRILDFAGPVMISRSVVVNGEVLNIREPDTRVAGSIIPYLGELISYEDDLLSLERPARHLIVIGSTRYNRHAEQLQKYFALPYEFVFASAEPEPVSRTLKIITEYGDELTASRDRQAPGSTYEVDYGILFVGRLSEGKRVLWLGGIHGAGTIGVFEYLKNQADQVQEALSVPGNSGMIWLLRVIIKSKKTEIQSIRVESLGQPLRCTTRTFKRKPRALICDLGNVLMFFDRARTYRAISHFVGHPYLELKEKIESTDIRSRYELGRLTDDQFIAELNMLVQNKSPQLTAELLKEFWADIFWPNNEMFQAIRALKEQEVWLILLSNTNHLHYEHVTRDYPEIINLFDRQILSYQEGLKKPDPKFFELALEQVRQMDRGIAVEEIVFVDDIPEYVDRGLDIGMQAFLFRSYPHFIYWLRRLGIYVP